MAVVKSGSRPDRDSLRAAMLAQGCGIDEIAAEMRARWGFALRAAYRHANGLTLDQAADRCNTVANDADTRTSGSRISDWEGWPQTGRRPSAFNLVVLAKSYGTQPRRLISPDEWEALDERERLILDQLGRSHDGQRSPDGQQARPPERNGVTHPDRQHPSQPSAAALTAAAARDSLAFASWAETSPNVSASAVDHLSYELCRIALNYVHAPLPPLFRDLTALRDHACELLQNGRQHPTQTRQLFFLAGTSCLLLAHASQNLGDSASAMAQVRAALTCAEQADHNGLRAWAHGTAGLIAEWTHQHRRAVEFAQRGQPFALAVDSRVRLAALEARAAARAGDRRLALDALHRAARARDVYAPDDELTEFGGLLSFPVAKQHYYAGSTYALLGDAKPAQHNALLAIGMYETGPSEQRSYGDEALARVDVTTARLALNDLDGAREALRPVLDLPPQRRIEQLAVGVARVRTALALPRYARAPIAREIAQELDQYQAELATRSLLLTR
ncbi:MAG: hypothetical protein ACRDS1_13195 [Pseudonocardiaceae bacterium]